MLSSATERPLASFSFALEYRSTRLRELPAKDLQRGLEHPHQRGLRHLAELDGLHCAVYGEPGVEQFHEDMRCDPVNPYGRSKWMIEQILADLAAGEPGWRIARLRYFNPVGAHASGLTGGDPHGVPNNLMPYITRVAVGRLPELRIFDGDWPTAYDSGVRDYIHVMDLVEGHVAALRHLLAQPPQLLTLNLGRGLHCTMADRHPGDIAAYCHPRRRDSGLAHTARPRCHVPRRLVLATGQPRWLRRLNSDVIPHGALICLTSSWTARPYLH